MIASLDAASREAIIRVGGAKSGRSVVLELPSTAKFRRYSPDSIRFSDAQPCRLDELKAGDQVKARGDIARDGARFVVEALVSGAFRDFAATIVDIDADKGTMRVTDLAAKVQVEARVLPGTLLRRLSPEIVRMLGTGAGNSRDLQSMIEALPPIEFAELKTGDAVVVSGAVGEGHGQAHRDHGAGRR